MLEATASVLVTAQGPRVSQEAGADTDGSSEASAYLSVSKWGWGGARRLCVPPSLRVQRRPPAQDA